jgi:hypothetical protein
VSRVAPGVAMVTEHPGPGVGVSLRGLEKQRAERERTSGLLSRRWWCAPSFVPVLWKKHCKGGGGEKERTARFSGEDIMIENYVEMITEHGIPPPRALLLHHMPR